MVTVIKRKSHHRKVENVLLQFLCLKQGLCSLQHLLLSHCYACYHLKEKEVNHDRMFIFKKLSLGVLVFLMNSVRSYLVCFRYKHKKQSTY